MEKELTSKEILKAIVVFILWDMWIWILKFIREFFMVKEIEEYQEDKVIRQRVAYKFNTRKFWATVFCTPAALAIWLRIWEAWVLFQDIYKKLDKGETIVQSLLKFKDVVANGTPLSNVLSAGVLGILTGMATTAVGWYTWHRIKTNNGNGSNGNGTDITDVPESEEKGGA